LKELGYTQPMFNGITYQYYKKAGLLDDIDWHWTYDTMDWATINKNPKYGINSLEEVLKRMEEDVPEGCRGLNYPKSEEIILIHDHRKTSHIFEPIINRLIEKGITFKLPGLTSKNKITSRGVLYTGYKCNSFCEFCYYRFMPNKKWLEIDELKNKASQLRYFYKNCYVDITGGEPTIYPDIIDLVEYCKSINLKPIDEFLISFFGLDDNIDEITKVKNTFFKQKKAIENLNQLKIPIRLNITLHKNNISQLPKISEFAVKYNIKAVNFISFNPFLTWNNIDDIKFQEKYTNMADIIIQSIKILEQKNIEVKVRYIPLCILKKYEKNIYDFIQLSFDPFEWDFNSWGNYYLINPKKDWYIKEALRKRTYDAECIKSEKCNTCSVDYICDGFDKQYVKKYGFGEEKPYQLFENIKDPMHFIQDHHSLPCQTTNKPRFNYIIKNKIIFDILKGWFKYYKLRKAQK